MTQRPQAGRIPAPCVSSRPCTRSSRAAAGDNIGGRTNLSPSPLRVTGKSQIGVVPYSPYCRPREGARACTHLGTERERNAGRCEEQCHSVPSPLAGEGQGGGYNRDEACFQCDVDKNSSRCFSYFGLHGGLASRARRLLPPPSLSLPPCGAPQGGREPCGTHLRNSQPAEVEMCACPSAKAGTHSPWRIRYSQAVTHRSETAYGSPPSRGRQREIHRFTYSQDDGSLAALRIGAVNSTAGGWRASASLGACRRLRRDQFEQRVRECGGRFLWHVVADQRNGPMLNRAGEETRLACGRIG